MRVVHTFGKNAGATVALAKDVVRFGRALDSDVCFDPEHDRDASTHHAEARREGATWVIIDQRSRNGTFVNGQRVDRHELRSGDEVMFGPKGPRVRVELPAVTTGASKTVVDAPSGAVHVPSGAVHAPSGAVHAPSGAVHAPSGAVHVPSGAVHVPSGAVHAPSGAVHAPSGAVHAPSGAVHAPSGAVHAPSGAVQMPSGALPLGARHVPAPAAGARIGQRTMAVMIDSAVAAATGRSRPRKTQEIDALVDKHVAAATSGQRRSVRMLGFLLFVALGGLGGVIFWSQRSEDQISELRSDLANLPPEDPRRKEIEGRLGTLHPSNANFGRNLYDRSRKGIFMLAAGGQGFCSAFAVREDLLATNAHCVVVARRQGGSITAVENEGGGQVAFGVSDMRPHPLYRDDDADRLTPDVAVVTIRGKAAVVLELATAVDLQASGAGDDIYLIGFPGRLMDPSNAAATFLAANIGRITSASGRPGAFADNWLIQHDAQTTKGTSGSPIFNGQGKVIGINSGGYLEGDDQTIAGKKTEVVRESPYKLGMRIDLITALMR